MAQIDSNATKEQLEQMERAFALKRESAAKRRAMELARLSEERCFVDANGNTWTYIEVDGAFARITSCETSQKKLVVIAEIGNLPVREIGSEALSRLLTPEEIVCPDGVDAIGPYAFRGCENLQKLVLPASASSFSAGWFAGCSRLSELVLPGSLEAMSSDALACESVTALTIGAKTKSIAPGAFEKSRLKTITVDSRNENLETDGTCIYSKGGSELVALARKTSSYEVISGCRSIGKKAFFGVTEIERVALPESVVSIDDFAFAYSGLVELVCPESLVTIGYKAFLHCTSLASIELNDGLRTIGEEVFACSSLPSLRVPASVEEIGRMVTARSGVQHAGPGATFVVDSGNEVFLFDEAGCLYRRDLDGLHLAQMLEPSARNYRVHSEAVAIDAKAFAFHDHIESVSIPEGVRTIGEGAFRVCRKLQSVSIPDSLESVGKDAFIDTAIESFWMPSGLEQLGENALVTDGAHHEGVSPALRLIEVAPGNKRFFMHSGMLCRRVTAGSSIVVFTNSCERVDFPDDVVEVEGYAFNNAFSIRELRINARLQSIGACGLGVESQIRRVRIDVAEPIEGRSSFVLQFPETSRSVQGFLLALGGLGYLYLPDILAQYDSCIAAAHDYRAPRKSDNAGAYEQVKLIISRLQDPVLLTDVNRRRYGNLLNTNIEDICVDISRHDDREAIKDLADLGFLNAENIERVTLAVTKLQDAAMTGYLLEMKRLRFNRRAVDFDL